MKLKKILPMIFASTILVACQTQENTADSENDESTTSDEQISETSNNESGSLTIYSAGPGGMVEELATTFEEETGNSVELYQSTTGDVLGRLEAESDNPQADVVQLASLPAAIDFKDQNLIHPYVSENHDSLYEDWIDEEGYYYGFSGSGLAMVYNTDAIDTPPTDISSLTSEEYQDRIAMPDPSQSGTALDLISIKVNNEGDAAWSEFESLRDNGMSLAGANSPALDSVITGQNDVVYGGVDYMAYNAIEDGEPIDLVYPESGTAISPRPAFILDSSENTDIAEQYIDFLTSEAGQQIVESHNLLPANPDIEVSGEKYTRDEIPEFENYDWESLSELNEQILEQFMEIMR